jgi:hypothetical protein
LRQFDRQLGRVAKDIGRVVKMVVKDPVVQQVVKDLIQKGAIGAKMYLAS